MKALINAIILTTVTFCVFALTNGTINVWLFDKDAKIVFGTLNVLYWIYYVADRSGAFNDINK